MRATAVAQPNIALIKYWGKQDVQENLPAVGSLSITLESLTTQMTVEFDSDLAADEITVNGDPSERMLSRVSACLDNLVGSDRARARTSSVCNFPIAAGLASSASAFSALVVAANHAAGLGKNKLALARAAGKASGSAARSIYGGFTELCAGAERINLRSILDADDWPLQVIVAITAEGAKPVSSSDAMILSATTSPFYSSWVQNQEEDLRQAAEAVVNRDFAALASVSEHNCLKMHSVMWGSRPPVVYWNAATLACMETVRALQREGIAVFFTIDAGPQVKAVCLPDVADQVRLALQETVGVIRTLRSALGVGARLVDESK